MKALLGTSLFPPQEVYNTDDTKAGLLTKFLRPYVLVENDNGDVLYTVGNPGPASLVPLVIALGIGAALLLIIK
ncbi:MAG: hypothetical protein M0Z48_04450 [Nitrospiraceae bacterium]|nr:hypothetical protein [Nitrospiraceae bacterium]